MHALMMIIIMIYVCSGKKKYMIKENVDLPFYKFYFFKMSEKLAEKYKLQFFLLYEKIILVIVYIFLLEIITIHERSIAVIVTLEGHILRV